MLIAKHYLTLNGKRYTPGSCIKEDVPAEQLERLLRLGAVANETAKKSAARPKPTEPVEDLGSRAEDLPDTDFEAPEVDVMAGIVQAGEKKATKKPAARTKKPKGENKDEGKISE